MRRLSFITAPPLVFKGPFWRSEVQHVYYIHQLPFILLDATSSGEASNLQNRLRTLSNGLVGLRNSLHENGLQNLDSSESNPLQIEAPQQLQQNYSNVLQPATDHSADLDNFVGSTPQLGFGLTIGLPATGKKRRRDGWIGIDKFGGMSCLEK